MIQRRQSIVPIAIATVMLCGLVLLTTARVAAKHRYDDPRLLGLTKQEAAHRLGEPSSRMEGDSVWIYQVGKDPAAALEFSGDRVAKIWTATRSGFEPSGRERIQ